MAEKACAKCGIRNRYDKNPASIVGRLWRWHINFCPGWKAYFTSLPPEDKAALAARYDFKKYQ